MRVAALFLALFGSIGCYAYTPLETPAPAPGARLKVELTDQGTADLAPLVGPGAVSLAGRLEERGPESLTLAVSAVEFRRREEEFWDGEPVTIPQPAIARVFERRVSRTRSTLASIAVVAGAVILVDLFSGGETLFGGKSGGGGSQR